MAKLYGYALHTIHRANGGKVEVLNASEKDKITVFQTTREELDKLESLGAAREANANEVAIFKAAVARENGLPVEEDVKEPETPAAEDAKAPANEVVKAPSDDGVKTKSSKAKSSKDDDI